MIEKMNWMKKRDVRFSEKQTKQLEAMERQTGMNFSDLVRAALGAFARRRGMDFDENTPKRGHGLNRKTD